MKIEESWEMKAKKEIEKLKPYLSTDIELTTYISFCSIDIYGKTLWGKTQFPIASIFFFGIPYAQGWGFKDKTKKGILVHDKKLFDCLQKYGEENNFEELVKHW